MERPLKFALVGVGKIVREQHLPLIAARGDLDLVATVSLNGTVEGIPGYTTLADALAKHPEIQAMVL